MRERPPTNDLRAAWERNAPTWVAWARAPEELDSHYHLYHRDLFLELLPAPAGRTLDLGCGEGRLARDLVALGHNVAGVDASPTMIAAAREAAPELELHLADAATLPFPDASFALVVAFMSLQDMDDMPGAVRQAARVLEPGGRFCFAVVHPLNSAGAFDPADPMGSFAIAGSYLDDSYYTDTVVRDGSEQLRLESLHRPLQAYAEALAEAGLLIERLREPALPEHGFVSERSPRWRRIPLFLHVRALKPA